MRPEELKKKDGDGSDDSFSNWVALKKATDETRAKLVADIVGHPKDAPCVKELDYMNPSIGEDAVRNHLKELREADIVEELVVEPGSRVRGYPYKFYQLTDEARRLFDENGIFPEEAWKRQYERVEKTAEIRELEEMPRPSR